MLAMFQSTRLREARLQIQEMRRDLPGFQSTRLREARRHFHEKVKSTSRVSIHAPA